MMYIHGGGGFFGSINTHRYALWRLARKTSGRVFGEFVLKLPRRIKPLTPPAAVSYRLAPQYPFPCARTSLVSQM
jgi:acetyl esterase/lipase